MYFAEMPIVATAMPSIGSLLGTTGHQSMIDSINESLGSTHFASTLRGVQADVRNAFYTAIVAPVKATAAKIEAAVQTLLRPDVMRPLVTIEDLRYTPPSMQLPILLYAPVQELFQDGRISGYGFDPEHFKGAEDVYGRLISNGLIEDVLSAPVNEEGFIDLSYEWADDDPVLSDEELEYIDMTRQFIKAAIDEDTYDPTDVSSERG